MPIWIEYGSYGRKEYKKKGNSEDEVLKDFWEWVEKKDAELSKRLKELVLGVEEK